MQKEKLKKPIVVAIIQARMSSTRLPGKVLFPLPCQNGKPIIELINNQLKKSELIDSIIVGTTSNTTDDPLTELLERKDISYYRGHPSDVFSRFKTICTVNDIQHVVRITADNPLIDIDSLDKVIHYHLKHKFDYTITKGLPIGMNFEVFSVSEFLRANEIQLSDHEKEHVTVYLKENSKNQGVLNFPVNKAISSLRLTIDHPCDFALFNILLPRINRSKSSVTDQISDIYENHNWIFQINNHLLQKKHYTDVKSELSDSIMVLEDLELFEASQIIRNVRSELKEK